MAKVKAAQALKESGAKLAVFVNNICLPLSDKDFDGDYSAHDHYVGEVIKLSDVSNASTKEQLLLQAGIKNIKLFKDEKDAVDYSQTLLAEQEKRAEKSLAKSANASTGGVDIDALVAAKVAEALDALTSTNTKGK